MNPILLQKHLKENNKDLEDFCKDLKNWGEELKKREPVKHQPQKEPIKPNKSERKSEEKKKIPESKDENRKSKVWTYEQWDKYDAEAECEKIDNSSDSELSDEFDPTVKEEALVEKDKGNRFVKDQKWDKAIECYTRAIDLFAYDPIFHANRALCYLKKYDYEKAERDCNTSLKLDNTYVKAYQRRAAAREGQNKIEDAKLDLLRVLELEPKNIESKKNLDKINQTLNLKNKETSSASQKPISKFSASRQLKKDTQNSHPVENQGAIDTKKPNLWPSNENVLLIKPIKKAPNLRSQKPLRRININEINSLEVEEVHLDNDANESLKNANKAMTNKPNFSGTIKSDDLKIIERKHPESSTSSVPKSEIVSNVSEKSKDTEIDNLSIPNTSVQFYFTWKRLDNDGKYKYLKLIPPTEIPNIFQESLDSTIFSEILNILATNFVQNNENSYDYVFNLTKVKRFSAMTMFMSLHDKNCLWKIFNKIKENDGQPKENIDTLIKLYEL